MANQAGYTPAIVPRRRAGPLHAVLDEFVRDLRARGHTARTIADYVREAGHLGRWMDREGLAVDMLNASALEVFLEQHGGAGHNPIRSGHARPTTRAALRRLLASLQARRSGAPTAPPPIGAVDRVVQEFLAHATRCRGVGAATCREQGRHVRAFLAARFPDESIDLGMIDAHDLRLFVAARAARGRTKTAQGVASALRAFLRFVVLRGLCRDELVGAVPTVAHRAARLPRHLSDEQLGQLLGAFDRSQAIGRRDHAIALCLARLGLRVGEVVGLRLGDVGWREGLLCLAAGKSRRAATLPLLPDVGGAIAHYLRHDRPTTVDRHVFVTHVAPVGRGLAASAARAAIRRAFGRVRLQVASRGTHVLRHTVATSMVCKGASLKEVSDVLRHRSLDTTMVYARVDLPALRSVAMPWPEVR